ncbi:hypothetical protein [Mycobacterium sp. 050134]|uniref:hypothetical protein n=1 Tax=Mycobacterium sp. 050134 TaxID=3096111 RepID=UPI002ED799B9
MSRNDTEAATTRIAAATENVDDLQSHLTRERLWGALTDRDEHAAAATVFDALDAGMTPEDVLNDFPRARRLLHAAKVALDAESPGAPE